MADRYGAARSPQPDSWHTCKRRRRIHRTWEATSHEDCKACQVEAAEGWQELLASVRREVFVNQDHGAHRQ